VRVFILFYSSYCIGTHMSVLKMNYQSISLTFFAE